MTESTTPADATTADAGHGHADSGGHGHGEGEQSVRGLYITIFLILGFLTIVEVFVPDRREADRRHEDQRRAVGAAAVAERKRWIIALPCRPRTGESR